MSFTIFTESVRKILDTTLYFEMLHAKHVPVPLSLLKMLRALAMDRNGPSLRVDGN